jgi:hypothetical protein
MTKNKFFHLLFALCFCSSLCFAQESQEPTNSIQNSPPESELVEQDDLSRFLNVAVIQALNKTTAKTSLLEIRIGEKIAFGQIVIVAHKCWESAAYQKPESKILLEVFENKENQDIRIFYGWMFASSPSISGIEHPIYDLTAIGCKSSK